MANKSLFASIRGAVMRTNAKNRAGAPAYACVSAWNKDPVGGVIGVQTGPH